MYYHIIREISKDTIEIKLYSSCNSIFTSDIVSTIICSIENNRCTLLSNNLEDKYKEFVKHIIYNKYPGVSFD
jgi:hypothetical protein